MKQMWQLLTLDLMLMTSRTMSSGLILSTLTAKSELRLAVSYLPWAEVLSDNQWLQALHQPLLSVAPYNATL